MAAYAISHHLKPNNTTAIRNPSFIHLFSSSNSTSDPPNNVEDQKNTASESSSPSQKSHSSFSSYFSDVKASLKQQFPSQRPPRKPFSLSSSNPSPFTDKPSQAASLEEIRKNLSEYRRRSAFPPPPVDNSSSSSLPQRRSPQHLSFQELYNRNVISKGQESNADSQKSISYDAIRERFRQLRVKNPSDGVNKVIENMPRMKFTDSLRLRPENASRSPAIIGGTNALPASVFAKEMREKKLEESASMKTEFLKMYTYGELGEKLRKLRPEKPKSGDKWFSLGELNERLMKLREIEEKESESRIGGLYFKELRESLVTLSADDKAKTSRIYNIDVLGQLGGSPNFMMSPPKEKLVEKYFHPDMLSSSEKMKLELKKVRDEFKMSESDCGSSRVQVAQLTTKIKHLSTALHKKDKHSRKGLQAMVQRRKKLLKYLRRTDWDSYCLVLSKLGLRDNPDYKN